MDQQDDIGLTLDRTQIAQLIDAAGDHPVHSVRNVMLVKLMYGHALRLTEACELKWKQLDMFHGQLILGRKSGKVIRDLNHLEMGTLRDLKGHLGRRRLDSANDYVFVGSTGEPLTPDGIRKIVTKAAAEAGLEGVNPRVLRRSAGKQVGEDTGSVDAVQSIMGVSDRKNVVAFVPGKKVKKQPSPWGELHRR